MKSVTNQYRTVGVEEFYKTSKDTYDNPHSGFVKQCLTHLNLQMGDSVLDIGCGDGLVTKTLMKRGTYNFVGVDKFMADRYNSETGYKSLELDFVQIATGQLKETGTVAICSYMVDIIPESLRATFFWELSRLVDRIVTIRPNNHELSYDWLQKTDYHKHDKSRMIQYIKTY